MSSPRPSTSKRCRPSSRSSGDLTSQGVAVVYISHRLEEIREVGDRVTVLKDGRTVATDLAAKDTPTAELIRLMTVARSSTSSRPARRSSPAASGPRGAGTQPRQVFVDVTFSVRGRGDRRAGGLVGSGRSEFLESVYGARKPSGGTVTADGQRLRAGSAGAAVKAGTAGPEERKSQGLLLDQPIYQNITVSSLGRFARRLSQRLVGTGQRVRVDQGPRRTASRRGAPRAHAAGGNQQKVVLARGSLGECRVLLLDEPTRGVDVGARSEIYTLVRSLAASRDGRGRRVERGRGGPGPAGLDMVLVVGEGRIVHSGPAEDIDEHKVLDLVMEGSAAVTQGTADGLKQPRPIRIVRGPGALPAWAGRARASPACCSAPRSAATLGLVVALVVLCLVGVWTAGEQFASIAEALTILRLASVMRPVSVGMTFVITGGGIDRRPAQGARIGVVDPLWPRSHWLAATTGR